MNNTVLYSRTAVMLNVSAYPYTVGPPEYRPPRNKFNIILTVTDFPFLTSFPNWRNSGEKNVHNYAAALNATLV